MVNDNVNHPSHYETGKFECINVMTEVYGVEAVKSFCICNAFKYLYRCMNKHDSPIEDIKKARWYIDKYISLNEIPTQEDVDEYCRRLNNLSKVIDTQTEDSNVRDDRTHY